MMIRNGIKAEIREKRFRRSDAFSRTINYQIILLSSFAHVRADHRSFHYTIGNLMSGSNTRPHIPVVWTESGASGSYPLALDVPIYY